MLKKLKFVSLVSCVNGCLGKRKGSAKAWEGMLCLGNNDLFGLAGILYSRNGKDEQSLNPVIGNEAGKLG